MLTDLGIRKLKPSGTQVEIADGSDVKGLSLRLNQSGKKTFFLTYRRPQSGAQTRLRLGEYDPEHFPLAKARELGRFHRALLARGVDPKDHLAEEADRLRREQELAAAADQARRLNTFAAVVGEYVEKFQRAKKDNRTWKETQRMLLVNGAEWVDRPVADITRRDVHRLLDGIMASGKGYSANRTYTALKTFFRWCASRDLVQRDPMQGLERPFDGEQPRVRSWSDEETKAIWKAADGLEGNAGPALKLLLLMGQRRDEVFHLRWSELEEDGSLWRLTLARSKSKREHVFPLPPLARRIVAGQNRPDGCDLVFPTANGRPIVHWSGLKTTVRKRTGIIDFTFHQARHTLRTALDRLGVAPHIKDQCLNHAPHGVGARHYSHYGYIAEQLEAFEAWAAHVQAVAIGEGVAAFR